MIISSSWRPAIYLGLAIAIGVVSFRWGWDAAESKNYRELAYGLQEANKTSVGLAREYQRLMEVSNEANRDIDTKFNSIIAGLRSRPSRPNSPASSTCTGASGAELSREDGLFLAREAARADRLRSALRISYEENARLRETLGQLNASCAGAATAR